VQDMDYLIRINNDRKRLDESPIRDFQMHSTKLPPYYHHLLLHFLPCILAHRNNLFLISPTEHPRLNVLSHILS